LHKTRGGLIGSSMLISIHLNAHLYILILGSHL
jgi:hypothetical protein